MADQQDITIEETNVTLETENTEKKVTPKKKQKESVAKKDKRGPWFEGLKELEVPERKKEFPLILLIALIMLVALLVIVIFFLFAFPASQNAGTITGR